MLNIALIGAGQLGSRHLQGLALLEREALVTVVDPGEASLATAKERFEQVQQLKVQARFTQRFEDLPATLDGVVIATGADVRRKAIESLLRQSMVKVALLEKVLFQKIEDYSAMQALLDTSGVKAWVNCAQRLWPFFRGLRPLTLGKSNVQVSVSGANWGLACNAIHNLDLLSFLTGDAGCRIESAMDAGSIPSKRHGFIELTGTLYGFGARGNRIVQTSYRNGDAPFAFDVQGEDFHAIWRVADGSMRIARAAEGWKWQDGESRALFQSQLTHTVLLEMIESGSCALPTYMESAAMHVSMLQCFLEHISASRGGACAIT